MTFFKKNKTILASIHKLHFRDAQVIMSEDIYLLLFSLINCKQMLLYYRQVLLFSLLWVGAVVCYTLLQFYTCQRKLFLQNYNRCCKCYYRYMSTTGMCSQRCTTGKCCYTYMHNNPVPFYTTSALKCSYTRERSVKNYNQLI